MKAEYKNLYEKFGLNVVYYRKRRKMTQLQLAELVDIVNIPQPTPSQVRREEITIPF